MAAACGFKALYLSGGGVAANSLGVPDLGISTMDDVLIDIRRITDACALPLLVDADTGWGGAFNIARTVKSFIKLGAAGLHIEDQVQAKRCGHRPGKEVVSKQEMVDRVKAAVDARTEPEFVIMARTDALAVEGIDKAIERAIACVEAGADMIFPEAMTELPMYRALQGRVKVPVLANITEFGQTPLYTREELGSVGVDIVLHCCSAYRAMNAAALETYQAIRRDGTQKNVLGSHADSRRSVQVPRLLRVRSQTGRAVRRRKGKVTDQEMTMPEAANPDRRLQAQEIGRPVRRDGGQYGAVHGRAKPATICITAATTFSTSPPNASSKRSPICWCTRSCRTARNLRPTRPS